MGFSDAIKTVLTQKYATFAGRASRSEFWWFMLFYTAVVFGLSLFMFALGGFEFPQDGFDRTEDLPLSMMLVLLLIIVFVLATVVPIIALTVRRLHDRDLSGWWYLAVILAGAIPMVGGLASLVLLVLCALPGTSTANRFGPDPLAVPPGDPGR